MKDEIEQRLKPIIGYPLWSIGRAADLEWFHFGNQRREVPLKNGETKIVSDYALHLQCAWRICKKDKIIVASRDRYYPPGNNPNFELEEFDWDTSGGNRLDERISELIKENGENPLIVLSIRADEVGSLYLILSCGYSLEVFPDDSLSSEYWRFFIPYDESEHFVITGHGIELE